jgi:hypothetical protein
MEISIEQFLALFPIISIDKNSADLKLDSETEQTTLENFLKTKSLQLKSLYIDSRCQFQSVAEQLSQSENIDLHFYDVRCKILEFLQQNLATWKLVSSSSSPLLFVLSCS